jgi:DNA-directed RNA polymerase specialized sigma subunit
MNKQSPQWKFCKTEKENFWERFIMVRAKTTEHYIKIYQDKSQSAEIRERALNQAIVNSEDFIEYIINKIPEHQIGDINYSDLVNAGRVGLMRAAETYNPEEDKRFNSYAADFITAEIQNWIKANALQLNNSSATK